MNLRILLIIVVACCCTFLTPSLLFPQITEGEAYELLFSEAILFQKFNNNGNDNSDLIDSARTYAGVGDYDIAIIFLEEIMDDYAGDNPGPEEVNAYMPVGYEFLIKTGIDFNRQEFEFAYLQSDSVLSEELQKPFVGLQYRQQLSGDEINGLNMLMNLRYDKENFTSFVSLNGKFKTALFSGRIDGGIAYDNNYLYPELGFLETYLLQYLNWIISPDLFFQADNSFRYKNYKQQQITIPSYFRWTLNSALAYNNYSYGNYRINYYADLNESINYDNNDYLEQQGSVIFENNLMGMLSLDLEGGFRHKRFKYNFGDSLWQNQSRAVYSVVNIGIPFSSAIRFRTDYRFRYKVYNKKSEHEPDYNFHELNAAFNIDIFKNITFETGYRLEKKNHFTFEGSAEEYIKEQNYKGDGFLLGLDYSNYSGYLVSLSGSYTWRRYPDMSGADVFSIYGNKNIISLFLIIQLPVSQHINFSVFASYDNDQDIDVDNNNTRSSFFTAELQYKY